MGFVPPALGSSLATTSQILIAIALAAIGLSTRPAELRRTGLRPLALGAVLWLVVAITGLALQGA